MNEGHKSFLKETVKKIIPGSKREAAKKIYYTCKKSASFKLQRSLRFVGDTLDLWTGKRDRLTPPQWMIYVGAGDFKAIGEEFFHYFIKFGRLQPGDKILEVGCGIGRMAIPLTGYLENGGSYEGFDIIPMGIEWCKKNITPKYPNFHFQQADIYNNAYNPFGTIAPTEFRFPFPDESFDFVYLTSVFTHMLSPSMENYFHEIQRVLKEGGHCLITFFLLTEEALKSIESKTSAIDFQYYRDGCWIKDKDIPEAAVAYKEEYVKGLFKTNHLDILEPVHYGSWCGRKEFLSFQDIIVARKNGLIAGSGIGG